MAIGTSYRTDPRNRSRRQSRYAVNLGAALLLVGIASCSLFAPSRSTDLSMSIEELSNGFLVHIITSRPVGEVSTVISTGNWLLITIADSTLAEPSLASVESPLVDSLEVTRFSSALQISLHLTMAIDAVDIIHQVPSRDIMISLFARKDLPSSPDSR